MHRLVERLEWVMLSILLLSAPASRAAGMDAPVDDEATELQAEQPQTTPLPTTRLFAPLRADPKEPRFFMSALQADSALRDSTIGAVGFGEHFGIVRHENGAGTSLLFDWAIWAARAVEPCCWSSMTALRPMGSSTRWMCAIGERPLSWPTDIARELQ